MKGTKIMQIVFDTDADSFELVELVNRLVEVFNSMNIQADWEVSK
jgi:hypothetical protein